MTRSLLHRHQFYSLSCKLSLLGMVLQILCINLGHDKEVGLSYPRMAFCHFDGTFQKAAGAPVGNTISL
jgi:hypothetical protein